MACRPGCNGRVAPTANRLSPPQTRVCGLYHKVDGKPRGRGELGSAPIEAGLVDEIGLDVHPLLPGGGTPAVLPMARRVVVEPIETRPIAEGRVLMRQRLVNQALRPAIAPPPAIRQMRIAAYVRSLSSELLKCQTRFLQTSCRRSGRKSR
jgi:hypothetical protein